MNRNGKKIKNFNTIHSVQSFHIRITTVCFCISSSWLLYPTLIVSDSDHSVRGSGSAVMVAPALWRHWKRFRSPVRPSPYFWTQYWYIEYWEQYVLLVPYTRAILICAHVICALVICAHSICAHSICAHR